MKLSQKKMIILGISEQFRDFVNFILKSAEAFFLNFNKKSSKGISMIMIMLMQKAIFNSLKTEFLRRRKFNAKKKTKQAII